MGNQSCLQTSNYCPQSDIDKQFENINEAVIPSISLNVKIVLENKGKYKDIIEKLFPFLTQIQSTIKLRKFGQDIYQGQLNQTKMPHGIGKMYKQDGSVFIGNFINGIANGLGVYILNDGSYYEGGMMNNVATSDKALFYGEKLIYEGGFKNNQFHGEGEQNGVSHKYKGLYENGKKKCGELRYWISPKDQYIFYGKYDQDELFTDNGILEEPFGKYQGEFKQGKKQGKGKYTYKNNLCFEGDYYNGQKSGYGEIYSIDTMSMIYEGNWKNGLPQGEGIKHYKNGEKIKSLYKDGINILTVRNI